MSLIVESPAFRDHEPIPSEYTCEGQDISPPLNWRGQPVGTRSLVLIVDDPDAPDPAAPRTTWVHWVVYNIPPNTTGLPAGIETNDLPAGAQQGLNDWRRSDYGGPCPPVGRHRYFHKLYALDRELAATAPATKAHIEAAMKGHILDQAVIVGTYRKSR